MTYDELRNEVERLKPLALKSEHYQRLYKKARAALKVLELELGVYEAHDFIR